MPDDIITDAFKSMFPELKRHLDMTTLRHWSKKIANAKNVLNKSGEKYYSQNDEDGILLEILNRINKKKGSFLEIGVAGLSWHPRLEKRNGTENNTIILLMLGWKGIWIDSRDINIRLDENSILKFDKKFITKNNCTETVEKNLELLKLEKKDISVISVDIDGNDFYIVQKLLDNKFVPDCLIVEYNSKFPPPILYNLEYDENYKWTGYDNQGTSLQYWMDHLEKFNYKLVCCNITGSNAFFVNKKYSEKFKDIPKNINDIFYPADYNWFVTAGHAASPKTIEYFANKKT